MFLFSTTTTHLPPTSTPTTDKECNNYMADSQCSVSCAAGSAVAIALADKFNAQLFILDLWHVD